MWHTDKKDKKKTVNTRRVISYFWHIAMKQKRLFIFWNIWGIITALVALRIPVYYAKIIDVVTTVGWLERWSVVPQLIAIVLFIWLLELIHFAWWRLYGFCMIAFEVKGMKTIYEESFAYLNRHSYKFFTNNFSGSLLKKMNKLVNSFETFMDIFSYDLMRIAIMLPLIVITIAKSNMTLGLVFLWFIVFYSILQYIFYKAQLPYEAKSNEQDSKLTGELSDTITNNFNILTFASVPREIKRFGEVVKKWKEITHKKRERGQWMFAIAMFFMFIFEVSVLYLLIVFWGKWLITAGIIVLIQAYIVRVFEQLYSIRSILKQLNRAIGESAEMLEILDEPHEIKDHTKSVLNISAGKIEFNAIKFGYADGNTIFDNLDLRIKPGEKVAIVGQSGSGKTTLIKLLFRFFDIQWGTISVDGQDVSQVTQDSLRSQISMVPQDTVLFHRTIRENIAYGNPDATQEEIIAAAKMARCHDFISKMKDGYETTVGERGIKLSGWERQRVAIARAILENTRILVLDEATSSLDSESEFLIQEAMDEVMKNKTSIVIAHRLSTIMKMDKIIVMDKWQIIEKWSHKELLAKEGGIYKKLRDIQSGGFIVEKP